MHVKEKAPIGGNRIGAKKQESFGKHPVPIVTHVAHGRKRIGRHECRPYKVRLKWTPVNVALLLLLGAVICWLIVRGVCADPLEFELTSMADSVLRV